MIAAAQLPAAAEQAAADPWVVSGRKALDQWWGGYPWYDRATDSVARVDVPVPSQWDPNLVRLILDVLAWTVVALVVAILAYMVYRFVLAWKNKRRPAAVASPELELPPPNIEALPFAVDAGPRDLLAEARHLYRQGDYARAILYLFSHQLVELDRRQIIHLARGKTNRQYLREAGARQGMKPLVERTMVAFEDVFFGNHGLDRDRFERCWSELPQFNALLATEDPA